MMKFTLALTGLLVVGALLSPATQAQNPAPSAPTVKQRAPGVPLAPRSGDVARGKSDDRGKVQGDQRAPTGERPPPQPERDPPMPRGVPSIMAP
ncbi:hypothetical protein ACXIUS_08215 [Bosea thiooxidans]